MFSQCRDVHSERQRMNPSRRNIGSIWTFSVVVVVAVTLLVQNFRTRGPFHVRQYSSVYRQRSDADILCRGWPFAYYKRFDGSVTFAGIWGRAETRKLLPMIKRPAMDWRNLQSWAIVGNVAIGILMLAATTIATEYWRRHRTGPFQFSLRSLFLATTVVAVIVAMIDNNVMHVSALLYFPIAFGLLSVPAVVGLLLRQFARRSDRRLSRLRSRCTGQQDLVQSTPMDREDVG